MRSVRSVLIVAAIVVAVILLTVAGAIVPVTRGARWAFLPVARVFAATGSVLGGVLHRGSDVRTLTDKNRELEARLAQISVDYVRLRALEEENRSLRAVAKFIGDSGYDFVSARVIARSTEPQAATVLIDRGAQDGLELGMAAVVGEGLYVGKVTELRDRVSVVTLTADERSRVAAAQAGAHKLIGLVEGMGNGVARLTLVPQPIEVKRDDVIVTAGTEEKIPANLPIGLVNDVESKPTEPFKNAALEPFVAVDEIDYVIVLRPSALAPK